MNWISNAHSFRAPNLSLVNKYEKNKDIHFSKNSIEILQRRYLRKGSDGAPAETVEEMFDRMAKTMAEPDTPYRDASVTQIEFYNLLSTKRFFPNSPTFTGAGTPLGQLAACFVLPISDDLGRNTDGIFSTLRVAALIQQTGGGNGFSFSKLRPRGSRVRGSNGVATGPVGFMSVYDKAFGEVAQGGVRRGANMGVLRVDHPDVKEFIKCKASEGTIANFNISLAITDKFMQSVKDDTDFELINPQDGTVAEVVRGREIFEMLVEYAHHNGEPGVLFIDRANAQNPVPHLYELEATNPCGEQWLGPYENCCLGSINLAQHVRTDGSLDWELLGESVELSTRFLDNVVTANHYVPAVPQLREAALDARRIGLGYMGLADVMYAGGIVYGSEEGQEFAAQVTEFMRFHAMKTSIALSRERGPFRKIEGSIYDPRNLVWEAPKPLKPYRKDYGRPALDWNEIKEGIKNHGIRNAATTTIAPTGTISTVAGIEGYGCEPVFALAYYRNVFQAAGDDGRLTLTYVSPLFEVALESLNLSESDKKAVMEKVLVTGSCANVEELPANFRKVFAVSSDITPDEHIQMQASIQAFIDNSISKTCNFPVGATVEDVAKVFIMGWDLGCKGLTVYVTGSRTDITLETKEIKDAKSGGGSSADVSVNTEEDIESLPVKRAREYRLDGSTYKVQTPQGNAYVTINKNDDGHPTEVFANVGKAGSDVSALSEALGRVISGWLQTARNPETTAKEIVSQLIGIGGARSVGFGKKRVSSIPDAIAKVLAEEYEIKVLQNGSNVINEKKPEVTVYSYMDVCPECGNTSVVQEEGCAKCYNCGYSVC